MTAGQQKACRGSGWGVLAPCDPRLLALALRLGQLSSFYQHSFPMEAGTRDSEDGPKHPSAFGGLCLQRH